MFNPILNTGISVAYAPENCLPIVDIVFVHGLQGHPSKTWTYRPKVLEAPGSAAAIGEKEGKRSAIHRVAIRLLGKSSKAAPTCAVALPEGNTTLLNPIFWPADLLPKECPNSRILTFGYDSKITKYTAGSVNQNSILSHGKDLLFALRRERDFDRPLVFVAHSLGGIVVKEMLAQSSSSPETDFRNIVESTAMVVFLGTPHRGSQGVAALGEVARSVVSSLGMETTPVILDALGLRTTDLERAQEDFSRVWLKYNFQVKTFQEGLSLAKLGKKVVPDYSSLIGDYREHAETLQANHIEMCRYSGPDDPNYCKVAGELHSRCRSITKPIAIQAPPGRRRRLNDESVLSANSSEELPKTVSGCQINETCLGSLWFPAIHTRYQSLQRPADDTCSWLFDHELYQDWFNSKDRQKGYGLLWLRGKPGAGKSTLMKEAFRRAALGQAESSYRTVSFFFNARGDKLEYSCLGLFRSLLYQLLAKDKQYLRHFQKMHDDKAKFLRDKKTQSVAWSYLDLMTFFEMMLVNQKRSRTIIFIDALDECEEPNIRMLAYFWRRITKSAYELGVDLNVCLSSRHFPTITLDDCAVIIMERHNSDDIATYVGQKFQVCMTTERLQWNILRESILTKSAGIFLWVVLVVEDVLKNWDDGKDMPYLIKRVTDVPEALETLFSNMFSNLEQKARKTTAKFFQWAILATKPLRLHEWHHIMAFIRQPALRSLSEWRQSIDFTKSDEQLEKQIRSISRGLVEVQRIGAVDSKHDGSVVASIHARAGSLDLEYGDTRIVQVIHESVRDFFLTSNGFGMLDSSQVFNPIGNGHLSIMATCLDYLNIAELDALVEARLHATRHENTQKHFQTKNEDSAAAEPLPHYENHVKHRHDTPNKKNWAHDEQRSTRRETASVFERLRSMDYDPINIADWMSKDDCFSVEGTYSDDLRCKSATHSSEVSQSRLLEDYPALLSYASVKLFTHAQLADKDGADLLPFVERLKDEAAWARWVALREDIPKNTSLSSYLVKMGLEQWEQAIRDIRRTQSHQYPEQGMPAWKGRPFTVEYIGGGPTLRQAFDEFHSRPPDEQRYHGPRSVASFESAGTA
ncbi:hypothetical protein Trihar35433_2258 [Trichoderma harzianum]|nr:hypothetical protein Trihar35433_2258 [Trichoderma harzianum]